MIIHPLKATDWQILWQLQQQCFDQSWSLSSWQQVLEVGGTYALLAQKNQQKIGYLVFRLTDEVGDILSLGVIPSYRRQGTASCLIRHMMEWGKQEKLKSFLLEVSCKNLSAQKFYQSMGFKLLSIRPNYYYNPPQEPEDAMVLCYSV
ncbi:MAG TPA: ribosomal protein S18-alanine N-acetyltransferase [Alphaproteobacteria bacterium]|nr:ribosomal protein S18-alanine N-acetyltransferase [Alphaproteobacteria bacterium]